MLHCEITSLKEDSYPEKQRETTVGIGLGSKQMGKEEENGRKKDGEKLRQS